MNPDSINCTLCGRFIKYKDLDEKKAIRGFNSDNHFSGEDYWAYHVKCLKNVEEKVKNKRLSK